MARKRARKGQPKKDAGAAAQSQRAVWMSAVAIVLLAIVPYLNTLRNGFVLDDVDIVAQNPLIRDLGNVGRMFATDYWSGAVAPGTQTDRGLYRPLTVTTFAVDYALGKQAAAGYHATNIAVHAGTSLVVFRVASALAPPVAALAAAALFAVHPIHTEAVTGIVGRAELLATLFFMLAFMVSLPRRSANGDRELPGMPRAAGAAMFYLLGLFSKESAATFPIVLLVFDWLYRGELFADRARAIRAIAYRYGFLTIAAAIYLFARSQVVSGAANTWIGWVGISPGDRALTAIRVASEYLGLLVFPRTLLAEYWKTDVPISHSVAEPRVLLAVTVLVAIVALVIRFRRETLLTFAAGFFAITLLPVSNLLFSIGVGKAERILYLPSVGFCLIAAWAVAKAMDARVPRWLIPAIAFPLLIACAGRTIRRNADWRDQITLAFATLRDSPGSPLMSDIAGLEFARRNEFSRAIPLFAEAVRQAPNIPLYHNHLGAAYLQSGRLSDAERELVTALRADPNNPDARNNLGAVYLAAKKFDAAIAQFTAALRVNPGQADAHSNLGVAYMNRGDLQTAAQEFREALRLQPDHPNARRELTAIEKRLPAR